MSTKSTYSPVTCSHLNPTLFAEKLPKQSNLTLHQVIAILLLPSVVADHITSLLNKHKFGLVHFPYLTSRDLDVILHPPFPTPPLQCSCKPVDILSTALKTIAFQPTLPPSTPSTARAQIIACLESYNKTTELPSFSPGDIVNRIAIQLSIRNILLSLMPQQLDVNVTLPQHQNLPTSFDIDRVVDDLQHCYALLMAEEEEKAQSQEIQSTLADLGIIVPPSNTTTITSPQPPSSLTPPTQSSTIKSPSGIAGLPTSTKNLVVNTNIANNSTNSTNSTNNPNNVTSVGVGTINRGPSSVRPASSSLRPSKYHTLNLRKETNVSITKLDSFGNHTPIYGDEVLDHTIHSQALSSPQASTHLTHSVFKAPSPHQLGAVAPPSGGNNSNQSSYPTLGRILSSQPQSSSSISSRSSTEPSHFEYNSGIKTISTQHPQASPLVGPSVPAAGSGGNVSSLFARAKATSSSSLQSPENSNINNSTPSTSTTIASDSIPSPHQVTTAIGRGSPVHGALHINTNVAALSVDSFSLHTPRGRSGTNPNLLQLADRFAIGNTGNWVPYWKKSTQQLEEMLTSWDFAMFQDVPEQHRTEILLRLAVFMFVNCGVVQAFNIPIDKLTRFLHHVSSLYRDNPYHNHLHAWTTLHYTFLLIKQTSYNKRIEYSHSVVLSMLLASICHDIDHPGNNNHFEVQTMSKLAMLHNDNSVLENHHCFVTFSLLSRPEFSILGGLTKQQLKEVRGLIVSIILNTDMALHNDLTDSFGKASEELLTSSTDPTADSNTLSVKTSAAFALIARVLVHCSDIAGQALPLKSAYIWAMRLRDEFTNQADTEARLGLPVTPFMTGLDDLTFARSQLGFIRGVLRPLWVRMSITFPATKPSLQHISDNESFWQTYIETCDRSIGKEQRNFSITSTLATPVRASITKVGRKYTLDEHYVRHLQATELAQVPETEGE